jgi:transposase
MFTPMLDLAVSAAERAELAQLLRQTSLRQAIAKRARVILALGDGLPYSQIGAQEGCTDRFIAIWKRRYVEGGVVALADAPRAGGGHGLAPALEAKIVQITVQTKPPAPLTHWSTRRVAATVGVHYSTVAKVWKRHGLKPHRLERDKASPDPDFETKATDIIGLYVAPPTNAVVFCVDEKTAIQALDRTDPVLPLSPGRAERHGFEYVRHGTLSLYAALDVATGRVEGKTAARHTSAEFLTFLDQVVASAPKRKALHFVVDNLSAHKTKAVQAWLAAHPRVTMHYTPTYSSWLNQVESWFARIERDCIARGIFTSTTDLRRKLLQYIKLHNQTCQPFVWRYRDVTRRMRATRIPATAH